MNILKKLVRQFSGQPAPEGGNLLNQILYAYMGNGGIVWYNEDKRVFVRTGYQMNADVYSIISSIIGKTILAPPVVYRIVDEKALAGYKGLKNNQDPFIRTKANAFRKKALEEISDTELEARLLNPNENQSWQEFAGNTVGFHLLTGEYMWYMQQPGEDSINAGKPVAMYNMPPQYVQQVAGTWQQPVQGYKMSIGNLTIEIPADQVIHVADFNPEYDLYGGHLRGQSPLRAAIKTVQQNNEGIQSLASAFCNSGAAGFVFNEGPDAGSPKSIEYMSQLQAKIDKEIAGSRNRGRIFATNGKIGWHQIGMSPVDLNIIDSLKYDRQTLCNVYHWPSILMGDRANAAQSNYQEARKAGITDAVLPELDKLALGINKHLVPLYGKGLYVGFNTDVYEELQEDLKKLSEWLKESDWLTYDEKREAMGYEELGLPGMDEPLMPTSKMLLSQAMTPIPEPDPSGENDAYDNAQPNRA
ncbi:MAG TPA: phage portal protein [Verrucomicrobiae bacterium]|nr:phage portal protein [Verrucomicrobiae bacterium]